MLNPTRSNPEGYDSDINGCILVVLFRISVFLLKLDTPRLKIKLIFIKKQLSQNNDTQ